MIRKICDIDADKAVNVVGEVVPLPARWLRAGDFDDGASRG